MYNHGIIRRRTWHISKLAYYTLFPSLLLCCNRLGILGEELDDKAYCIKYAESIRLHYYLSNIHILYLYLTVYSHKNCCETSSLITNEYEL